MNDLPQSPSSLLRATAWLARWLLGLLLVFWFVLVASWGLLHGWIVPRIAEYRPVLERQATRILGIPVRIGDISAQTVGLVPSFELRDITLLDAQGQVALRLPRVVVALSPRSVWHAGFEQLYIDRPELDIRRDARGKIFVAGLDMGGGDSQDNRAQEWFFAQTEIVIHQGLLRWTDEQRGTEPVALQGVDVLVRNSARRHALRIDASVPPDWGGRFSLMAQFRQPLLSRNTGNWRDWDGQVFANFESIDVSHLRRYADLGLEVDEGNGAFRLWADLRRGELTGATADVALAEVSTRLDPGLEPLTLRSVTGRLGGKRLPRGFEFSTTALQFLTQDGRSWPGGNVAVVWQDADAQHPAQGELHADQLDVAALGQMANLLPLGTATHAALKSYAPQGLIEKLDGHWTGGAGAGGAWPDKFDFKGRVSGLAVAAGPVPVASAKDARPEPGRPGLRGGGLDFELTQAGGKARLAVQDGALAFPGVFDDPLVPLNQLSAELMWQLKGEQVAVQVNRLRFANADAEGEAQISWHTSDPVKSRARSRFPGVLELQGSMSRADATRVYRYLPLVLPATVRDYVHTAVQQGQASGVKFRVKGDLHDLPFADPRQGEFRISANVQNAQFAYVPHEPAVAGKEAVKDAGKEPVAWPALTQLNGELVFERNSMSVRNASGRFDGLPGVQISRAEAQIPDLAHAVVQVNAEARGPLADGLRFIAVSPVGGWINHALADASTTGNADYRVRLTLPIREIDKSRVQGSVVLANNDIQLVPEAPAFNRTRGTINFSESGFALQGVQAALLGGETRVDGGTPRQAVLPGGTLAPPKPNDLSLSFRAQGTVSAEGLRQASQLGLVSRLAQNASGATSYSATLGWRRGVPEVTVNSNLQGLALSLPPPLNKTAEAALPLRFENSLVPESLLPGAGGVVRLRDQLLLDLGRVGSVAYLRDLSTPEPHVLRGGIGIGLTEGESAPWPEQGVAANINLGDVDVDAWEAVLSRAAGTSVAAASAASALPADATVARPAGAQAGSSGYLPTVIAVRAKELRVEGHKIKNVVVGGSRDGLTWRANLEATELSGYLEYRQSAGPNPGRVYARLARLVVAPSTATQVEAILDEQPSSIPALDIVVEDMELRGRKLGRVEIEAVNRGPRALAREARDGGNTARDGAREWRLNKFNVVMPEASLSAVGNWAAVGPGEPAVRGGAAARRTVMNFKLDITDAGRLLARFGMKDVVRSGKGKLEGQVAWLGSPLALDYPSLGGQFNVNVETGQFLKADPGLAKLLGVLSLQSLPRRLTLDFRDVFTEGFAFDFVRGDVKIDQGLAFTNNLQMKGVNAAVLMEGRADIAKETQDLKVVVVPEINAGTASLVASVINPVIGLTTFLTQVVLRRPLIEAATQEFHIDGTWVDPRIVKVDRKSTSTGRDANANASTFPPPPEAKPADVPPAAAKPEISR